MPDEELPPAEIPVIEERASVETRRVLTGRVWVRLATQTEDVPLSADLASEEVEITRVPVGRDIPAPPAIRNEGDLTIIPVVEEVLRIEKRLVLREEIHLRRTQRSETFATTVPVRRQRAEVGRDIPHDDDPIEQG